MGYIKGYFKKDGTYVQGHFTNTKSNLILIKTKKDVQQYLLC